MNHVTYGDNMIRRMEDSVDDEYQAEIMHKASSVGMQYYWWTLLGLGVVFAWVLPGFYSLLSILLVWAPALAVTASQWWMKRYAPRPRFMAMTPGEWAALIPGLAVMCAGMLVNAYDGELSTAAGMVVGGLVGGFAGGWYAKNRARTVRERDERRLDAEIDDWAL
ncbi:MAG: hypothetical protein ACTH1D_08740 [Mycobacteriaceae bacterium]|uniref:hypothetical protein n=1 Tax=Corynebacterium sp. TaxID=1720 RepID=UPI003F9C0C9A